MAGRQPDKHEAAYNTIEQALDTPNIEGQMLEIDAIEVAYIRAG